MAPYWREYDPWPKYTLSCTVANTFGPTAFGKVGDGYSDSTVFMEWQYILQEVASLITEPALTQNQDFMAYINKEGRQGDFTNILMAMLPSPRSQFYQSPDFEETK